MSKAYRKIVNKTNGKAEESDPDSECIGRQLTEGEARAALRSWGESVATC